MNMKNEKYPLKEFHHKKEGQITFKSIAVYVESTETRRRDLA